MGDGIVSSPPLPLGFLDPQIQGVLCKQKQFPFLASFAFKNELTDAEPGSAGPRSRTGKEPNTREAQAPSQRPSRNSRSPFDHQNSKIREEEKALPDVLTSRCPQAASK